MDRAEELSAALNQARTRYREDPAGALAEAIRCHEAAASLGDPAICARALALQGHVSLHRGDIHGGLELVVEAERLAAACEEPMAQAELATLRAHVNFFTGSYSDALAQAERAIELADATGSLDLQIFARRSAFLVMGQVKVNDLRGRLDELLELTVRAGDRWEEAVSHNDLACYLQEEGEVEAARREIDRALEVANSIPSSEFALAVIHSTSADIHLSAGDAREALADAEMSLALLSTSDEPNPYIVGATVRAQVQARVALGEFDDAHQSGRDALEWLGDRMPRTRSLILRTVATALHEAGRLEEAYDALWVSAELEREAFRELSQMQLSLERATLQARLARRETDALRDQAERDWLTGLYNRRFLAREFAQPSGRFGDMLSVAVVDLDHFKTVNDRFGHAIGDQVLVRAAVLLLDTMRASDVVVRSGGEEFLLLMPYTDARSALGCCERVRRAIESEHWNRIAIGLSLTASVGVATAEDPPDLESLVSLADQRLFAAKRAGRDRVVSGM